MVHHANQYLSNLDLLHHYSDSCDVIACYLFIDDKKAISAIENIFKNAGFLFVCSTRSPSVSWCTIIQGVSTVHSVEYMMKVCKGVETIYNDTGSDNLNCDCFITFV